MALHGKPIDAYRLFFPLGIVLGTFGVAIWPLYNYGVLAGFSGRAHAFVQTNGFLYAFILGFLLTAIPRFTGTDAPSRPVQYILATIVTVSALSFELQVQLVGHTGFLTFARITAEELSLDADEKRLAIRLLNAYVHDIPVTLSPES